MNQLDLNRQVAKRTGESLRTIARSGFSLVRSKSRHGKVRCRKPRIVAWDRADSERAVALFAQRSVQKVPVVKSKDSLAYG
jgi:hypothetical protein